MEDLLTVPEIQSAPFFVPLIKELICTRIKPLFLAKMKEIHGENYDVEAEAEKVTYQEIFKGVKNKFIDWDDLEFSRECLNFIERNVHMLD